MRRLLLTFGIALTAALWMPTMVSAAPSVQEEEKEPLNLKLQVQVDEAGTLFTQLMAQIEEMGELTDVGELTVTGQLNGDDFNVLRNQMTNMTLLDLSAVTVENGDDIWLGNWNSKLRRCLLPRTAATLHSSCFGSCDSLRSVVLPEALTAIPSSCFWECANLESIDIPATVTLIGDHAFTGCVLLKSIVLPEGLSELGAEPFWMCRGLTSIVLPDGLKVIPQACFRECSNLSEVKLPASLEAIEGSAFESTALRTFTLPEGVRIQGRGAFFNCDSLRTFYFPDGLVDKNDVGEETFRACDSLHYIRLPETLTEIPRWFFGDTSLDTIVLPASVRTIGEYAFAATHGPKRVVLPNTVTKIEEGAFNGWAGEEMVWPKTVTTIPLLCFNSCGNLRQIDIPETVNTIGNYAFQSCYALKSIHLPDAVTTLSQGIFSSCENLEEITVPAQLKTVGPYAFFACRRLSHIDLPASVTAIEGYAFQYCDSLKHVVLPDGVTSIGSSAFAGVPLQELALPKALKTLGDEVFTGGKYTHVIVPEGVLTIGASCFSSDTLKVVDLPTTIIGLGDYFVAGEKTIDSLIIRASTPPYGGYLSDEIARGTLYVPATTLSLYQANSNYRRMSIQPIEVGVDKLTITGLTTITPDNSLGTDKVDVEYRSLYGSGLSVSSKERPRLWVQEGASLNVGTFTMDYDKVNIPSASWWEAQPQYKFDVLLNDGAVTIDQAILRCQMEYENFFTPPFDVNMYDIVPELPNTPYVIYRYDSSARAAANFSNTWVKVGSDETLHAGQGYAFIGEQTPKKDDTGKWGKEWSALHFRSHQGGTDYLTTAGDITLPLNHYQGEFAHNRNWNFIGMPYAAFLDIRGLDYDGPIIVYNPFEDRWNTVTALDDEYVIDPLSGFFIQAPDGTNSITLDADRRQLGKDFIKEEASRTANQARAALRRADKNQQRTVFNLALKPTPDPSQREGRLDSHCRFVLNPEATLRYDIGRDAPTMANDSTPLLYTCQDGVALAINERPLADGIIRLGMQLAEAGTYSLSLSMKPANSVPSGFPAEKLWLLDSETGTHHLLFDTFTGTAAPYTFTATDAGILNNRFTIAIGDAEPTAITDMETAQPLPADAFFNLSGQRISQPQKGIIIHGGKKTIKK